MRDMSLASLVSYLDANHPLRPLLDARSASRGFLVVPSCVGVTRQAHRLALMLQGKMRCVGQTSLGLMLVPCANLFLVVQLSGNFRQREGLRVPSWIPRFVSRRATWCVLLGFWRRCARFCSQVFFSAWRFWHVLVRFCPLTRFAVCFLDFPLCWVSGAGLMDWHPPGVYVPRAPTHKRAGCQVSPRQPTNPVWRGCRVDDRLLRPREHGATRGGSGFCTKSYVSRISPLLRARERGGK